MIWNPQPFAAAHESLVTLAGNLTIPAVQSILEPIKDDLKELLVTPPKSETSRSKLSQKTIEVDDEVIELNDAFLNDAARVADELNVDELIAAKLAFYAIEDSRRLEIGIVESAITLFYVRRQYIIDIVRFVLEVLPVSHFGSVVKTTTERVDQFVAALKSVERSMNDLKEKAKTGEFMGLNKNQEFTQLLKLQRSFLISEHESLGNVLLAYLDATSADATSNPGGAASEAANTAVSARALLDHVASFDTFDSRFVAYSSALTMWFTRPNSTAFNESIWAYFQDENQKTKWKLPFWFAAIQLVFYIGLEDDIIEAMKAVELDDVLEAVRHSIDDGALEFWMSFAQDVSAQLGGFYFEKYLSLVRSRVPALVAWQPVLSDLTVTNLKVSMTSLVVGFIGKFADILKEMRLSEEDMYLAMNELEEDAQTVSPGMDLERFFLLVATVYRGNPEHAKAFFDDKSDDGDILHGFLVWGSTCRATLMAATFAELVGSLASDAATSESVYDFMLSSSTEAAHIMNNHAVISDGIATGAGSKIAGQGSSHPSGLIVSHTSHSNNHSDDFSLSWRSMIDVLEYYTRTPASTGPTPSLTGANTHDMAYQPAANIPYSSLGSAGISAVPTGSNFVMPNVVVAPVPTQNLLPGSTMASAAIPGGLPSSVIGASGIAGLQASGNTAATPQPLDGNTNMHYSLSQSHEQLTDDTLLVLSAYMQLISRVASHSQRANDYFRGKTTSDGHQMGRNFVSPLFKLLKMNQPINGPIFEVLAPFASSEMWRSLDIIMLGKFDEMLTSLPDALAFLGLLAELVKFEPLSAKFNEYVEFIFKVVLPWTTSPSEVTNDTSATNNQVAPTLTDLSSTLTASRGGYSKSNRSGNDNGLSHNQEVASHNMRLMIQVKCIEIAKCLLSKPNPNEDVFKVFFQTKVYEPLFRILCTGVDAIVNLDSGHPLAQSITTDVEVVSLLLKLSKPPQFAFDKPILYHLQVIPHLALYAGSTHTKLSLASIRLLSQLDDSNEFKPTISRQSRILSILSSTSEATRIRVGLMTRVGDLQTDPAVKAAILEMLSHELAESSAPKNHMSVAHYLLGFRQSELGLELKLELDKGIGGIQSGSSLLTVVCDTLLHSLVAPEVDTNLLRLCSVVLGHLCQDVLTSDMVLDYLRQFDFWINTMKCEPIQSNELDEPSDSVLEHRALMLEIWDREIKLCQRRLLLTIESHYIDALVPIVFRLVDLDNIRESSVALRCLRAWCELIPVLLIGEGQVNSKVDATFVATVIQRLVTYLPRYSRHNANYAEPVANLLVVLFEKFQQRGVDNVVARHSHVLFRSALESMQPAQMNSPLRGYLYTLFCQCLNLSLQAGSSHTEQGALDILIECGPKIFQIACDDILNCFSEELRFNALLFIQMSAVLGQRLHSKVIALSLLKYNFIAVFILEVLQPKANELYHSLPTKAALTTSSSSRAFDGVTNTNNKASSGFEYGSPTVPADNSLAYPGRGSNSALTMDASSNNDDSGYAKQTSSFQKQQHFLKVGFSLLLPIAQIREGAADMYSSALLPMLRKSLGPFEDDLLLLALQIMISMLISVGKDNVLVVEQIRSVLDMHQRTLQDVLHRDASLNRALQDQSSESELSLLAREVAIIVSLTNMKLTRV